MKGMIALSKMALYSWMSYTLFISILTSYLQATCVLELWLVTRGISMKLPTGSKRPYRLIRYFCHLLSHTLTIASLQVHIIWYHIGQMLLYSIVLNWCVCVYVYSHTVHSLRSFVHIIWQSSISSDTGSPRRLVPDREPALGQAGVGARPEEVWADPEAAVHSERYLLNAGSG